MTAKFRPALILACASALCPLSVSQLCYSENGGNTYNTNVSMGGPLVAIRFTSPANLPVAAVEIFTGEAMGTNSIAIWSHDATGNQPLSNLGTGTWTMSSTNSWQGASLLGTVPIFAGVTYWVVWGPAGGAQASVDPPGPTAIVQQYRASFNGGLTWTGPFSFPDRPWKFRFTCGLLPYQTNQTCASFDVDGVISTGLAPALVVLSAGQPASANFGGATGFPWDLALTTSVPLLPYGLVTAGGQVLNLDFSQGLSFLLGGTFQAPFAPANIGFSIPTAQTLICGQMAVVTPTSPDGFCLSQASAVQTL
jgi:hypothetical protein